MSEIKLKLKCLEAPPDGFEGTEVAGYMGIYKLYCFLAVVNSFS